MVTQTAWDISNPKFQEAWDKSNSKLIENTYKEIFKQWQERIPGATIADVYVLCRQLHNEIEEIEHELDQPIEHRRIRELCEALLDAWGKIFQKMEKNSYQSTTPRSGLYIYHSKDHLPLNDWIRVDGISLSQIADYVDNKAKLNDILPLLGKAETPHLYNVHCLNDGSISQKKKKAQTTKQSFTPKATTLQSKNSITADGKVQIPVFDESDFMEEKPTPPKGQPKIQSTVDESEFMVGDFEEITEEKDTFGFE